MENTLSRRRGTTSVTKLFVPFTTLISSHGFTPVPERAKPFRCQLAWTSHEGFDQEVRKLWKEDAFVMPALYSLSVGLNKWNKETFGNLFRCKWKIWAHLQGIQNCLGMGRNGYLIKLEARLKKDLREALNQIEMLWLQKSKAELIRDGD